LKRFLGALAIALLLGAVVYCTVVLVWPPLLVKQVQPAAAIATFLVTAAYVVLTYRLVHSQYAHVKPIGAEMTRGSVGWLIVVRNLGPNIALKVRVRAGAPSDFSTAGEGRGPAIYAIGLGPSELQPNSEDRYDLGPFLTMRRGIQPGSVAVVDIEWCLISGSVVRSCYGLTLGDQPLLTPVGFWGRMLVASCHLREWVCRILAATMERLRRSSPDQIVALRQPFHDIAGHPIETEVALLTAKGVVRAGEMGSSLRPDDPISRAEFCRFLMRALDREATAAGLSGLRPTFRDEIPRWAWGYVNTAFFMGVISGYPDGSFKAENPVTYAEAAKMLVLAVPGHRAQVPSGQLPYSFLFYAVDRGFVGGVDVGLANLPATRADVTLMLVSTMQVDELDGAGRAVAAPQCCPVG
jgi:hypothetical protein